MYRSVELCHILHTGHHAFRRVSNVSSERSERRGGGANDIKREKGLGEHEEGRDESLEANTGLLIHDLLSILQAFKQHPLLH